MLPSGRLPPGRADTNHLLSYSMIGAIFSGNDANTPVKMKKQSWAVATARCALDFWSINNYPHTAAGSEKRSADFGVAKDKASRDLPVLVTKLATAARRVYGEPDATGQSSAQRIWEALVSGAMGVHIFTWNDRDLYRGNNIIHASEDSGSSTRIAHQRPGL